MIKQKDLVFLLASSTVVVFIWIVSTLYHAFITSTITEPLATLIRPISAQFNTRVIQEILKRTETQPTYEGTGGTLHVSPTLPPASASGSLRTEEEAVTPTPTAGITPGGDTP